LSRKSSDSVLQQQTNSAGPGPTGRSTPTPFGAVTVAPAAPHSPILEDVSGAKANDTTSTVKASDEDSASDKPTMTWEPGNVEESGPRVLQNSEFNLDLDDILKIDSLPLLTVNIVFAVASHNGLDPCKVGIFNHFRLETTFMLSYQLIYHHVIKGDSFFIFMAIY
jgi:hypothetical protein